MKYIVVYLTDSGDLYHEECTSLKEAHEWVEEEIPDHKAVILHGEFLEDHT